MTPLFGTLTEYAVGATSWDMSNLEQDALTNAFQNWKDERMPSEKPSKAFEIFSIEQVLKDADLDDDEMSFGNIGGGGDGGVDGFFFFIDRQLVREDDFTPKAAMGAELTLIVSTQSPSFTEDKIDKLEHFCRYLLDWNDLSQYPNLRQTSKESMMRFRTTYQKLLSRDHSLSVNLHYVGTSTNPPSSNLLAKVTLLENYIKSKLSLAEVSFVPWGCAKLLQAVRSSPSKKLILRKVKDLSMPDESVVCLCTVTSYKEFLDDGNGKLRAWLMEPNVRDYLGNNQVNKQIRNTLNSSIWSEDFWWLNNGVTVLADSCSITGDKITIENPEIVNGLQTSYEIFNAKPSAELDKRHVLIKVVVARNDKSKNAIIKATNSQSSVSPISLKATEPIQFDIEDKLQRVNLFYERRKGKYRQQRKPLKNIVSITALGQAIIAAYLQLPSDSRARPGTLLTSEKTYPQIFNDTHKLDFYAACILIDRRCASYVDSHPDLTDDQKTDLRYYVTMLATCHLCGKAIPTSDMISDVLSQVDNLDDSALSEFLDTAKSEYVKHGGTDKAAKGREMETSLKQALIIQYPPS